jgi:hypothetical protein
MSRYHMLASKQSPDLKTAWSLVVDRRDIARPNAGFRAQLLEMEVKLNGGAPTLDANFEAIGGASRGCCVLG